MDKEDLLSEYNKKIQEEVEEAYEKATHCKRKGEDPLPEVEIDLAEDIAGRSEKLLGIKNLAEEMRKLEEQDYSREEITFEITDKICKGKIGDFENKAEKVEGAVRASVAILTEGIVAAPIDGIGEIEIDKNDDGTKFVRIPYFGPIRSAGGTGQALSVLVADYARRKLDISEYKPRNEEVERYVEELRLYDEEQSLQYLPPGDDIREIIRNTPVMLDGEQTTDKEVDGYRDLDRIKGNKGRGGMCLVVGEGIGLKAPKIKKYTDKIDELKGWEWIDKLIEEETDEEEDEQEQETQNQKLPKEQLHNHDKFKEEHKPHKKYLGDALAGRPLLAEPNTKGGFRLRYGRARNTGLASWGLNPATMYIVKELVAIGTQLKTEQPGKAAGISPVDSIQGPTVRLKTGEMKRIDDVKEARKQRNNIDKIIDLGEIAVPVGEYIENNHYLMPSSYVHEWWKKEPNAPKNINPEKLKWKQAINISLKKEIPLHPKYTYLYHDITTQNLETLSQNKNKIENTLEFPQTEEIQKTIETLLIPNKIKDNKIIITGEHAKALNASIPNKINHNKTVIQNISKELKVKIKPRALTRIGARMGRPEKAKKREMDPPVHALFPIGRKGGNTRNLQKASKNTNNNNQNIQNNNQKTNTQQGTVKTQLSTRECLYCETKTWRIRCPNCEKRTYPHYQCPKCEKPGEKDKTCKKCNREYQQYKKQTLSIKNTLKEATTKLNINPNTLNTIKAVKGLTSKTKIPEPLEKGILRSKHGIQTFRDGTSRYDMVDLPLTSFKPKEVNIPIKKLKQLGYTHDKNGNPLENQNQKLELYPQDIILNEDCGDYLLKVANYIDELLVKYYNEDPYYNAENKEDLIGELIVGLAPHTSGGLVGRIIGYTPAKTNYANPLYHAGKRRNTDGDEDSVMLLMDGFLNFSQQYLPDRRGKRSVTKDTMVLVRVDGEVRAVEISELVDDVFEEDGFKVRNDGFEVNRDFDEDIKVVSFDAEGEVGFRDVSALVRHVNDKDVYDVQTSGGSISVTEDHSIFVLDDNDIVERSVGGLEKGEKVVVPSYTDVFTGDDDWWDYDGESLVRVIEERYNVDLDDCSTVSVGSGKEAFMLSMALRKIGFKTSSFEDEKVWVVEFGDDISDLDDDLVDGDLGVEEVIDISKVDYGDDYVYDLEVPGTQNFLCGPHPIFAHNTMDAPLVLTTELDPEEVDDEAYNVETVGELSREFYEASFRLEHPEDTSVEVKEDDLSHGMGFDSVIGTDSIHEGCHENFYKRAGGMEDKTWEHMILEERLKGVDEGYVAEVIIEKHLMPDLIGNLTAFSRQETRCAKCNTKYRRVPLDGNCGNCGNDLILTIHEGSVKKYIEITDELISKYDVSDYTRERVEILKDRVDAMFDNDKVTQTGISDFMG